MHFFHLFAGFLILLFGRPLYWALVAVLGFVIGFEVVHELAIADSTAMRILLAVGAGILAAGLAVAFQWLAFGLVGFLTGSYLVHAGMEHFQLASENPAVWITVGGVIGAIIVLLLVDWAVIGLSSLAGAAMITGEIRTDQQTRLLILIGLTIAGVVFQRRRLMRKKRMT